MNLDYVPVHKMDSGFINFEQFTKLWSFLAHDIKLRIPQRIFQASTDGFNIHTLYEKCHDYKDSYHHVILLVKTNPTASEGERIFGAYLDEVPIVKNDKY